MANRRAQQTRRRERLQRKHKGRQKNGGAERDQTTPAKWRIGEGSQ